MKSKSGKVYMCATDWNVELFKTPHPPDMYFTVKGLKADRNCWTDCGIVQVELTAKVVRVVKKGVS